MKRITAILFLFLNLNSFADGCSGAATFTHIYDAVNNCYIFTNTTNNDCGTNGICTWDFGDGSPTVTTIQGSNTICHEFPDCDTYTISLTYDATSCSPSAICFGSYQVDINTFVPDNIDVYTSDCNGYNISCFGGSDGFIQISSLPPLCTVQWDDGTVGLYNGNLPAGVHGATIEDDQGCNYLFFGTLTEPPPVTSNIQIISNNYNGYDLRCYGDSTAIIDVTSTGGVSPYTYLWNNGEITHQISNLPSDLYSVNITDACGCVSNTDIGLIQPAVLEIILSNSKDSCGRGVANAEVEILGGVQPYEYLWSNNETAQLVTNLYEGSYTVLVTDENNCSISSDQIIIENVPNPIAEFNVVPDLNMHHLYKQMDNPIFFIDKSVDEFTIITKWFWEFEDGFTSNEQDTRHSFADTGDFNVTLAIENLYGCVDSITKRVIIEEFLLYIPNSFTPNGDEINDSFLPKGIGVNVYELKIYSRWGEHFFTSNDLNIGWNGTTYKKDEIAQIGVYVYLINVIDIFGQKHTYNGQVTLIK
jgi:gliding motility-associated-like protein